MPGPPDHMPILNSEYFQILDEFYGGGQTDRAKQILAKTANWKAGPDTDAARCSSYVGAIRDWSRDGDCSSRADTST